MNQIISMFMKHEEIENDDRIIYYLMEGRRRNGSVLRLAINFLQNDRQEHIRPQLYSEFWIPQYCATDFHSHFRMTPECFQKLVYILVEDGRLVHNYPGGFEPIRLEKKIQITLWYLAHEGSMLTIGDRFGVTKSTVYSIVVEFCKVMNSKQRRFIRWPEGLHCEALAANFREKSGIPGVIRAIDCTHIELKVPRAHQDSYIDKTLRHSMVLQGVCSADRLFTNVSVGHPGRRHDARILTNSWLHRTVSTEGSAKLFYNNYHLVGDSAYPCREWLLVPYRDYGNLSREKKRFNYKLSKTRVVIENVFGLLKGRWRRLHYLNVNLLNAPKIILTCCILPNFCLINNDPFEIGEEESTSRTIEYCTLPGNAEGFRKRDAILRML